MSITIFTDGSSRGNPGPGGWGAIVITDLNGDSITDAAKVNELGGREDPTTNNRMELTAALESLRLIRDRKLEGDIEINTDSAYMIQGITMWVYGWEKNNWLTKEKEPVLNQDLWAPMIEIVRVFKLTRNVVWTKVAGHAGIVGNERVDDIATGFADKKMVLLFAGNFKDYTKMLGGNIFAVNETPEIKKKKSVSSAKAYSYVSFVDGILSIDKTWAACEKRVKGKHGARFKKSFSKEDEAAISALFKSGKKS